MGRGRLRGWLALPWRERGQLLALMASLPVIASSVHLLGYVRTRRWLEQSSRVLQPRLATSDEFDAAGDLARLAAVAGNRGIVHASCLRQSLLVYWLLRRRGLMPELKLGVRKQEALLDAHAWVELEGRPLAAAQVTHQPFPKH